MKHFIIPVPMKLVTALRCVINYDIEHIYEMDPSSPLDDLIRGGKLNAEVFQILYDRSQKMGFTKKDIRTFLLNLGLAVEMGPGTEAEDKADDEAVAPLFVPSLISDTKEEFVRRKIKEMKNGLKEIKNGLQMLYLKKKMSRDSNIFHNVLTNLMSSGHKIELRKALEKLPACLAVLNGTQKNLTFALQMWRKVLVKTSIQHIK